MDNVSQDDWIVGGLALLLAIALLFFPWISVSVGPFTATSSGTGAPDAIFGVLALLLALAVLADLAIERLSPQTQIPEIGGSRAFTRMALAGAALVFVVLKFILHTSNLGWGFWVTVIVAIALTVVTVRARQGAPLAPTRPTASTPPSASSPRPTPPAPEPPATTPSAGSSEPPPSSPPPGP
jgi:hypothetical protein